jgi:hypothetical protein
MLSEVTGLVIVETATPIDTKLQKAHMKWFDDYRTTALQLSL